MKETFIIHAKRTPIGRINGSLSDIRVDDLMSLLIKDFKESINFDPAEIDDVLIGCANQAGEDNRNIARMSLLLGGLLLLAALLLGRLLLGLLFGGLLLGLKEKVA